MSPVCMASLFHEMPFWYAVMILAVLVVVAFAVERIVRRLFRDSNRHRVTVPAVFLYGEHVYGQAGNDSLRFRRNRMGMIKDGCFGSIDSKQSPFLWYRIDIK